MSAKTAKEKSSWTAGLTKHEGFISWSPEQYIREVGVNGHVLPALLDSGGEKSMMCTHTTEKCGLKYSRARGSEFGKCVTAGGHVQPYYGLIRGPIDLHFSDKVVLTL